MGWVNTLVLLRVKVGVDKRLERDVEEKRKMGVGSVVSVIIENKKQ